MISAKKTYIDKKELGLGLSLYTQGLDYLINKTFHSN